MSFTSTALKSESHGMSVSALPRLDWAGICVFGRENAKTYPQAEVALV